MGARATVESRRIRTWDSESDPSAAAARPAWQIIARYGVLRVTRVWYGALLLVLALVYAVVGLGVISYQFSGGSSADYEEMLAGISMFGMPLAAILIVVGCPMFAEDLRFNAPLFYFSKPIRVRDYLQGKLGLLSILVGAAVLLPVLIGLVLALTIGVPSAKVPAFDMYYGRSSPDEVARLTTAWHRSHIDTVADWFKASAVVVPAVAVLLAFLISATALASVYTRRAWHAGMALVAVLVGTSMVGALYADEVGNAPMANLTGPAGWAYLVLALPLQLMFSSSYLGRFDSGVTPNQRARIMIEYDGAGTAIFLAYVLLAGCTVLFLWLTWRRLRRQEAVL